MARRVRRFSALVTANTALAAGVETVIATLSGIVSEFPDGHIVLLGNVAITTGVGATDLVVRVRRAGLAGAVVGELVETVTTASASGIASIAVEDDFAAGAPPTYVLTAVETGGAATATQADLVALVT